METFHHRVHKCWVCNELATEANAILYGGVPFHLRCLNKYGNEWITFLTDPPNLEPLQQWLRGKWEWKYWL